MRQSKMGWSGLLALAIWMPAVHAGDVASVAQVDLGRYAGQWHEIARLPNAFQDQCVGEITAQYTLRDDGLVGVRNACRNEDGEIEAVDGVARLVAGHPGRLEVRFAPDWLRWLPLVWADYWIIALDPDYQWAVIGEPGRDYLWILARNPQMAPLQLEELKRKAAAMGYDTRELIVNPPMR